MSGACPWRHSDLEALISNRRSTNHNEEVARTVFVRGVPMQEHAVLMKAASLDKTLDQYESDRRSVKAALVDVCPCSRLATPAPAVTVTVAAAERGKCWEQKVSAGGYADRKRMSL